MRQLTIWAILLTALYTVKIEYVTPRWAGIFAVCVEADKRINARTEARRLLKHAVPNAEVEDSTEWKDNCDRLNNL